MIVVDVVARFLPRLVLVNNKPRRDRRDSDDDDDEKDLILMDRWKDGLVNVRSRTTAMSKWPH